MRSNFLFPYTFFLMRSWMAQLFCSTKSTKSTQLTRRAHKKKEMTDIRKQLNKDQTSGPIDWDSKAGFKLLIAHDLYTYSD